MQAASLHSESHRAQCAFIAWMVPKIHRANQAILRLRARASRICQFPNRMRSTDVAWLHAQMRYYHVAWKTHHPLPCEALLKRLDSVPMPIVLSQSINESAWGKSRFARIGHNFFGHRCYRRGCGMKPLHPNDGAYYAVARFDNAQASVIQYLYNLNTNTAYAAFRQRRHQLRMDQSTVTPAKVDALLGTLQTYSILRKQYIVRLRAIIAMMEALPCWEI